MRSNHLFFSLILIFSVFQSTAKEGMWVPILIEDVLMEEMKLNGLHLSAQDIYNANNSSLKDAVLRFGGGCTSELISNDGLLLTNHHCGYGQIQSHSSLENDYLKDGFWAKSKAEELKNPGLSAMRIVEMKDVTDVLLNGWNSAINRDSLIKARGDSLIDTLTSGGHYGAFVKSFYYGNQYLIFITETFKDVRLVGAPPSSIGKYGFDTDNWVWPRHTGDFSLFRIYVNKDNEPAEYNEENVPYQPRHHLPISLKGYKDGDFTMVYGFPYRTTEYLTSDAVDFILNVSNPTKIDIRTKKLNALDQKMASDQLIKIKYASKQSSTSNAWKKWKGQIKGLKRNKALEKKREFENQLKFKIELYPDSFPEYVGLLDELSLANKEINEIALARDYYIEIGYYGTDAMRLAYRLFGMKASLESGKTDKSKLKAMLEKHFKDYDFDTDMEVFKAILPSYLEMEDNFYKPASVKELSEMSPEKFEAWMEKTYAGSLLNDQDKLMAAVDKDPIKAMKSLEKDDLFSFAKSLLNAYRNDISPAYGSLSKQLNNLNRKYMNAIRDVFPDRVYYPDANGTLRLTYGKIEGMKPADAVKYKSTTVMDGVVAKYIPEDREYDLPERLLELHEKKDYGPYGENGQLNVCFIASNHTSGGNSGSPVLNGHGELIGLNFDRNWEGTMSDIMYDVNQCRNISVDIRYVLFIIDKFANASYLLEGMDIRVKEEKEVTPELEP